MEGGESMYGYYGAMYGYGPKTNIVAKVWQDNYEKHANKYWNKFYSQNKTNFFKDRHWLLREFPELAEEEKKIVMEVGCGVGNAVFPILEENPNLFIYACDFSSQAIKLVRENAQYDEKKCFAFEWDFVKEDIPNHISENSIDLVLLIFVLSAVSPEQMPNGISKLFRILKPGGKVLMRDYAVGDMAQKRFEAEAQDKEPNKLSDNFYVRGDGTRACFFTKEFLQTLFGDAGFSLERGDYVEKDVENLKEQKFMHRKWIQCVFTKPNNK